MKTANPSPSSWARSPSQPSALLSPLPAQFPSPSPSPLGLSPFSPARLPSLSPGPWPSKPPAPLSLRHCHQAPTASSLFISLPGGPHMSDSPPTSGRLCSPPWPLVREDRAGRVTEPRCVSAPSHVHRTRRTKLHRTSTPSKSPRAPMRPLRPP